MRSDELSVGSLAEELQMSRQATSNQLRRLSEAGIVVGRQEGLQVFYRVIDPCVPALFDRGWCHVEDAPTRIIEESVLAGLVTT
jgi:DNA-binding transcriptional ArsR family regulator